MLNKHNIREFLKDCIADRINDSLIEDAILNCIGQMDFSDRIGAALEDAIETELDEYVDNIVEDVIGEVVSGALEDIFSY